MRKLWERVQWFTWKLHKSFAPDSAASKPARKVGTFTDLLGLLFEVTPRRGAIVLNNSHVVEYLQGAKGWNDYTLEADQWAAIGEVTPTDAAMLLCYHNPNESSFDALSSDETGTTTYETPANAGAESMAYTPKHLRMLARRLADIDKAEHRPRTLRDWHQTARVMELTYHSWIDEYMEATAPPVADTEPPEPQAAPVAVVALGGTSIVWTLERKTAARAMKDELRGQGNKSFAANTAAAFGVTATRLRDVLNDKPKKAPAKRPKEVWDV